MNREAAPLICGLFIPIILVLIFILRIYGIDVISYVLSVDTLYLIVLFPIVLGLVFALMNRNKD